jgi:transcriptional regulator with XRE-family HTH domain
LEKLIEFVKYDKEKNNYTQQQHANILGIDPADYSRFLKGKRQVSDGFKLKVLKYIIGD